MIAQKAATVGVLSRAGTVMSRLHRARGQLRGALKDTPVERGILREVRPACAGARRL